VSFSSIGPTFDGRVKPDVMALGFNATISNTQGSIVTASGTSFSSPILCGLVACLWQALPNKTNQQIVDLIKASSDRFTTPNAQYGYGIPDFSLALNNGLSIINNEKNGFLISPNPTAGAIKITFSNQIKQSNFQLFNAMGQIVIEKELTNPALLSLENLSNGIYFYKIQSNTISQTGKIVKN